MSAKSSTFAPQMIETMNIEQMTHTCWRCRHSAYITKAEGLHCPKSKTLVPCRHFLPSEIAEAYFNGLLKGDPRRATLTKIYTERMKAGTF